MQGQSKPYLNDHTVIYAIHQYGWYVSDYYILLFYIFHFRKIDAENSFSFFLGSSRIETFEWQPIGEATTVTEKDHFLFPCWLFKKRISSAFTNTTSFNNILGNTGALHEELPEIQHNFDNTGQ
jgi:hypothetical protein